ncbi:MAG: branched-chain amino acid ABC transporter permease [Conexivisphaerales archaeon]
MVSTLLVSQLVILGLMYGLLYGVLALGLNIVWGVMRVVNIAHGDFVMVGSYTSYWAFVLAGINPIISLLLTIPLGFALGTATYLSLVKRVQGSEELMSLFLTFGLSTLIGGLLLFLYSPTQRAIPIYLGNLAYLGLSIPVNILIASVYAIIVALGLRIFFTRTFWGKAIRAVIDDKISAMLVGINPSMVSLLTFGIGIAIACSVGSIIMLLESVSPVSGPDLTLISFVIVVLGGLGNPAGALVGGVLLGVVESVSSIAVNAAVTPAIGFIILFIVLIVRPQGIMGSR